MFIKALDNRERSATRKKNLCQNYLEKTEKRDAQQTMYGCA